MNMLRDMLQPTRRNMLRGMFTSTSALTRFGVNGVEAALALDFIASEYRMANTATSFADAFMGNSPKLTYNPGSASSSQSTMTNSSGEIVWAPHNLLAYSEDFEAWSNLNVTVTVTDNATTAPDGTLAYKIVNTGDTGEKLFYQLGAASGQTTVAVYAKAAEFTRLRINELTGYRFSANFDLSAETATLTSGVDGIDARIKSVGGGWYLCEIDHNFPGASNTIVGYPASAETTYANPAYDADDTSGIYIWGAHVYRSDLGGMAPVPGAATGFQYYVPTNGSAVYLPRVGHHVYNGSAWVNEGLLIESEARTNLLLQSQDLTNVSVWAAAGISPTRIDNNDGSFTLEDDNASGFEGIAQTVGITSGTSSYTASVDIKKTTGGTSKTVAINFNLNGGTQVANSVRLNTDTGTITTTIDASVQDVGDYWRVSATVIDNASGNTDVSFSLYPATDDHGGNIDDATVVGSATFRYPQLEQAPTPSSYIPTNGSTVTRGGQSLVVPANWYDVDNPTYTSPELVDEASDLSAESYPSAWTIGVGSGSCDGTQGGLDRLQIKPNGSFLPVGVYVLSFDVTSGSSTYGVYSNSAGGYITSALSVGSYSVVVNQSSLSELKFVVAGGDVVSIDNISVRQVSAPQFGWPEPEYIGPELWTTPTITDPTVWDWDGSTLTGSGDGTSDNARGDAVTAGGVYRITYNVTRTSGLCQVRIGNTFIETVGSTGLREFIIVAGDTTGFTFTESGSFVGSIDNISVREINPLSVSIQMDGRMTYADNSSSEEVKFTQWPGTSNTGPYIRNFLSTLGTYTGAMTFRQYDGTTPTTEIETIPGSYTPGILVPYNWASRHGSTFVNGAVDGVALDGTGWEYGDTTPTALPDLSNTDLQIAQDFMGTIGTFRQFAGDIGDTGLVTATNPSTEPTLSLTFDGTEGSFYNLNWSE